MAKLVIAGKSTAKVFSSREEIYVIQGIRENKVSVLIRCHRFQSCTSYVMFPFFCEH